MHPTSYNDPMDNSECLMLGRICAYLAISCIIDKSNSLSNVYLIICLLGHFQLMIFFVGSTLFWWEDTDTKFTMHPEAVTADFFFFIFIFIVVADQVRLLHTRVCSNPL